MRNMFRLLASVALMATLVGTANADVFSEFFPNPAGGDPDPIDIELSGTAGAGFDLWVISVESDATSPFGTVDRATNVTGTYDANGLAIVSVDDPENPSFTYILTDAFTGTVGTSTIDGDSDGTVDDTSFFGSIMDAIGIPDTTGEVLYGTQLGGTDFAYTGDEPGIAFRDASTGAWYAINEPDTGEVFDINANNVLLNGSFDTTPTLSGTLGAINPTFTAVPEPGSALVLAGLFGLVGLRRRK